MKRSIAILGAGPAGLALALQLLRRKDFDANVTIFEKKSEVGGLTASFEDNGLYFDHGSHRLHPATDPEILKDISDLLGPDLLIRPRNGRIRLLGSFVKFPLNPLELLIRLPLSFSVGIGKDSLKKLFLPNNQVKNSFADILLDGLGETICKDFYFPYARKLWGLDPEQISAIQAQRRVSANTVGKIIRKILSIIPGFRVKGAGKFYYPRKGYGQISSAMNLEVKRLGGRVLLSNTVKEIHVYHKESHHTIYYSPNKSKSDYKEQRVDFLFSTIPVTILARMMKPEPPKEVLDASENLKYRSMVLVYFIMETDRFTKFDAHYFPEENVMFSRLSEPKNYSGVKEPHGTTGICIEIPCQVGDPIWSSSESVISTKVLEQLETVDLPIQFPIKKSFVRHVKFVYPLYDLDYESRFNAIDNYISRFPRLVSLGRQGLFAHDNTHHTIEMAYRANECLESDLNWNIDLWQRYRHQFNDHVVED